MCYTLLIVYYPIMFYKHKKANAYYSHPLIFFNSVYLSGFVYYTTKFLFERIITEKLKYMLMR